MTEELGRPSYKARPVNPPNALPPQAIGDAAPPAAQPSRPPRSRQGSSTRRPGPAAPPKAQTKKVKRPDPPAEAPRPAYPPVKPGRGLGYAVWVVLRFVGLMLFKLARTMLRIALSPFHAAG